MSVAFNSKNSLNFKTSFKQWVVGSFLRNITLSYLNWLQNCVATLRMMPRPIFLQILNALYQGFQVRYHLFQKFFGKMVKIKEMSLLSQPCWFSIDHHCMSLFHRVMAIVYKSSTVLHFWNLRISPKKFKLSHWLKKQ